MNLYGPAENFNNVPIGTETTVTVYGKSFTGPYKGNSAASGGVLMYGVDIGSSLYTNGKGYVYDCTVTVNNALRVNSGGAYEIINTVFDLASSGNGLALNQASTNVTTVSGSTFRTGSNISVTSGDILEFQNTNYINANISISSGTVRLANNAGLVFGNSSDISIGDLTFGSGNSITFGGTGKVAFASGEDFTGVSITVDTSNLAPADQIYTLATNVSGVTAADITVTDPDWWRVTLTGTTLKAETRAIVAAMYGPADKFGGASVGDKVAFTAYGKKFAGTYYGDSAANGGVMMYGVTISSTPFTNGKGYVYDCTVTGGLQVNSGGSYEIVNTVFQRSSAGYALLLNQASTNVTTVTDCSFSANSQIYVKANDILEFRGTNRINSAITVESGAGTVRLADDANIVFGNSSGVTIGADLTFGNSNSITFSGAGLIKFDANENLAGVAITVDTTNYSISSPTTVTVAKNFAGVAVENITVTGANSQLWTLSLNNGDLTATSDFTKVTNLYGPAAYFPGATVGDTAVITAYGKNFVGTYQGDGVGNTGSMMYGSTISTSPYTNGQNYVYDCTVTGQLVVNSGGAYEIVNSLFSRASSGNVLWVRQTSSRVTTISGSTFLSGNNIAVESGDVVEFRDTNYFNASITIASGTVRLADDAALVFGNTSNTTIGDLTFGSGNAVTLKGTGKVTFASGESFTGVAVTVDTSDFELAQGTYTLADNFAGVAIEDITVTGTNSDLWNLSLSGGALTAKVDAVSVTNLYGPAEKFPGASVGDQVFVTADGKNFLGTYRGDGVGNSSSMMYGSTISTQPYTNNQSYIYDCTVSNQLIVNSGGAYEIVNTTFNRASSGNVLWVRQTSSRVTTISGSTFLTGNNIAVESGDVVEFRDTNYFNGSITIVSGTVRLADDAALVLGNTSTVAIGDLTFGSGNAITLKGTGLVGFASGEDFSNVALTVDTSDFAIDTPRTYTLAQNVGGVAVEDITVTGAYSNLWTLSLNNGTLTATSNFTKVGSMYGPAEKFPGATVGSTTSVTAEGKNFVGTYQGDGAANGSVFMYGVTVASGLYTNGQAYAYDCTVSGQLKANSGGAYEIVNTTFNRTSTDNVIWLAQASSKVTTVSGSTFLTNNNIAVEAGDVLEFRDTNYLNADIAIGSTGGTVRLADNAALVFGNTSTISIASLTLGTGNALTFNGTARVGFTSQDLSAAAITVSADLLGESTVIATGVTLAADQGISVGDNTYTLGETFIYGDKEYAFNCTGNTFSLSDVTKYDEVYVAPDGTQSIVIDGQTIPLAGKPVYTSLDSALDHMAANGSVTVYNTTDSVLSTYAYFMSTQTVNGDLNIVADGLDFTRYYVIGNAASTEAHGNVSGDIYFEFRNAETERIMLSGENKAHDLCRNGVITVKDATVTGYISGGGSGANCRIAGDITINVTDSTVAAVYATRGNPVGGEAVINLSGSTVGTVAKTDGAAVTVPVTLNVIGSSASEITGNASGLDAITVNSGATLQLGAGAQVNNTVVKAGGALEIASGANTGAKLTLDFNGAASGAATGVNDLSRIGASTTVYVEGLEQSYGTFTLGYGATGNEAFALGFGDGNDYTMNGELTSVVDAFTGKTYSTSVDAGALKITAAAGTHTIAAVAAADSLAVSGATFNGSDREAKWTADTIAAGNVYLTSGMTDGNAWLELDGYDGGTGTTLYGTAANQTFDGAVNVDLKSGSLRNLAAGAGTGGSVKAVNLTFDGATLNGTGYAGGFGSVTGTTDTRIADGTFTKDFYAGALANKLDSVTGVGDISMTIEGGTFSGNIYGASAVKTVAGKNGTRHTAGDVTLTVTGGSTTKGTQACIFAGGYATGDATGTVYTVDSVTATISGGSWGEAAGGRGIFGGVMASGVTAQAGNVNLTVSGGSMGNVYGGGWAQKTNGKSIVGDVNISISGGTIANVFGGGSHSTSGGTTETGDVTITVSGGNITGDIFARGQLDGDTTGNAAVIFTGAADFDCGVFGYSYVGGAASDATLSYTGYTGEFAGAIGGFDGITFDGATAMTLATAAANVSNGAWEFDLTDRTSALAGTSLLTWSTADFENDTIKVSFADDAQAQGGWNIATVANAFSGTTFDVKIGDSEIASDLAYGQQIAAGDYAGFGFELESGVLKFKNIA